MMGDRGAGGWGSGTSVSKPAHVEGRASNRDAFCRMRSFNGRSE